MKLLWFGLSICAMAVAQSFGGGLKVGGALTDATSPDSGGGRYVIGPYVEIRLPGRFGVEVDALYRPVGSFSCVSSVTSQPCTFFATGTGTSYGNWEFPLLPKDKLRPGPKKPYIEGGVILSHLTGSSAFVAHSSNYGVALGAGV